MVNLFSRRQSFELLFHLIWVLGSGISASAPAHCFSSTRTGSGSPPACLSPWGTRGACMIGPCAAGGLCEGGDVFDVCDSTSNAATNAGIIAALNTPASAPSDPVDTRLGHQ